MFCFLCTSTYDCTCVCFCVCYAARRIHWSGEFLISSSGMVVVFRRTALGNWLISWFWKSSLRSYSLPRWINTLFWSHRKWIGVNNDNEKIKPVFILSSTSGNSLFILTSFTRTVHQELVDVAFCSPRHKSGPVPKKLSHWLCHTPYHSRWTHLMNTRAINSGIFYFCSLLKSTDPQCPIRYFMSPSVNYLSGVFRNLSTAATFNSLASVLIMWKKKFFWPLCTRKGVTVTFVFLTHSMNLCACTQSEDIFL